MTEIDHDSIIEAVKKKVNRAFEAFEKLDADTLLENYHNHADLRFIGLIFGEIFNLTYGEFTKVIKGGFGTRKAQKFIRETEFFNVLSDKRVLYNTTGEGYKVPNEGERMEFNFIITMIYSLIEGEWKVIHETEAQIAKKEE